MKTIIVSGRDALAGALQDAAYHELPVKIVVEGTPFVVVLNSDTGAPRAWWLKEGNGPGLSRESRLTTISKRVKRSAKRLWR